MILANLSLSTRTTRPLSVCWLILLHPHFNSLAIPISNGNEDHPDPTCSKPKTTKRIRTEHEAGSGSTRDTLKARLDNTLKARLGISNRAEARIFKANEAGGGNGKNRAIINVLNSIKRRAAGEEGIPSVFHKLL